MCHNWEHNQHPVIQILDTIQWGEWIPETSMSSHVANICSRKGHSPASNPRRLKVLFTVVTEEHNQYIVTILGDHNSVTKPFASLHETGFLLQLQRIWEWCNNVELVWAGGAFCGSQGEWMLQVPKRNGGNGFLKQTCRHMLLTSAAERLTDRLPTHGG